MKFQVVEHDPKWKEAFSIEANEIKQTLDELCIEIFHIGSTSVPHLLAKPIIDMLLVVRDIHLLDYYSKEFETLGYEVMGEFGMKGRRYFRKGRDERTHQIHAFQYDQTYEIIRHVAFRNYLRARSEVRNEYGQIKQTLAKKFSGNAEKYMDGKDRFIKQKEQEALIWHWQQSAHNYH